jgi:replication factor C subunit 3/5
MVKHSKANLLYIFFWKQMVSKKEGITLPTDFAIRIAERSERNLRRALLMLEACKVQQ